MATIAEFKTALIEYLDGKAAELGESTTLTPAQTEEISRGIDEVNETVNPNLPTRPTS